MTPRLLLAVALGACTVSTDFDRGQPLLCGQSGCPADLACIRGECRPRMAPVAVNDNVTTSSRMPVLVSPLDNDFDPEGRALRIVRVGTPVNGGLVFLGERIITYTPRENFEGTDRFQYDIENDVGLVATAEVEVLVVNHPPIAVDDEVTTAEDTPVTIAVLGNDSEPEGMALIVVEVSAPEHGTAEIVGNARILYVPAANFSGTDTFGYVIADPTGKSAAARVRVNVTSSNDPPLAVADAYTTDEDMPLTVAAPGVLGNDAEFDGAALTAVLVTGPAHGILTLRSDGSFVYTPSPDYAGPDAFTYRASNGTTDSAPVEVTLTVNAVNDAPQAQDDGYVVRGGTTLAIAAPGVLGNDTDVDGDSLSAVLVSAPAHGTLALQADGSFSFVPEPGFAGVDAFTYRALDGLLGSGVATVVIRVNAAPVAVNDVYTTPEDTLLSVAAPGVLANDVDADGDPLTGASLVEGPAHGALTLSSDGSFSYIPAPDYNGLDAFTYRTGDAMGSSNVATVTITVGARNDAPRASADAYTLDEDTTLTVPAPGVLANDGDVDGDPLTAVLESGPSHGTLVLAADGSITYTPVPNYNGTDSFTYRASDGVLSSEPQTVTLTIVSVPDAPRSLDDEFRVNAGEVLAVSAPGVLANDTDADGDALTAALLTGPAHGTLSLLANGAFSYTPAPGYAGLDSFTYRARDATLWGAPATVRIFVNAAPVAAADVYGVNTGAELVVSAPGILANDTDPEAGPLSAVAVRAPAHGTLELAADGGFRYTPEASYVGLDSFTYRASDGFAYSGEATVTIRVNGPPTANDDIATVPLPQGSVRIAVLDNDTDPEGEALTVIAARTDGTKGTVVVEADQTLTYTALAGFSGQDLVQYDVRDEASPPNQVTGTVRVLARPAFGTPLVASVGAGPVALAVGDIDQNGLPDVAVVSAGSSSLMVLFQSASGLTLSGPYSAGSSPTSVAIGHLLDHHSLPLDVAITSPGTDSVLILDGADLAGNPRTRSAGVAPSAVVAADIDVDGRDDLVVVDAVAPPGNVRILYGSTFQSSTLLSAGAEPSAVAVSDLDGNGLPDIVVANRSSSDVTVLRQESPGVFTAQAYAVPEGPAAVAIVDLNGDGRVDIAVTCAAAVTVLLQGTVRGSFAPGVPVQAGSAPAGLAAADLNGDGRPDLVVANGVAAGTVSVLVNATDPGASELRFAPPVVVSSGGASPSAVAVGALSGDPRLDIVVANRDSANVVVLPRVGSP